MRDRSQKLVALLDGQPVVPVITVERLADAVPLARALAAGGLKAIEVTLRTPDALDAIRLIAAEVPQAVVGAGTVLTGRDYHRAVSAGARFAVSPGTTQDLLDAAVDSDAPFLPGATTPSEIMAVREEGYTLIKFFPAELSGGAPFLRALAAPLATVRFCPTGGVSPANVADYLALPNVACVGGSWVAPDAALSAGDWARVETLAREAAALGR
ncbi:2-dehydro-3-deoxy-phosphogluconate aldolase [Aquibium sp. A9E412]|uniref:2-dehydro-3-deoxy-phosphogluconate aldolase n=1 Tax=Aquibium sp. A9E412 TaxID=2976767 RepID=UPI0025AFAAD2|nr:2-dehydro-3-deoxy-phosphogluconate aldolase [Aquibium sp. A9E412]MDN2567287.1 2-dehydro-3-deoxy-phosphogluconate aldolase [Aquibium sp. A9E412]